MEISDQQIPNRYMSATNISVKFSKEYVLSPTISEDEMEEKDTESKKDRTCEKKKSNAYR